MAKKEVAPVEPTAAPVATVEPTDLATLDMTSVGTLARPASLEKDLTGTEDITRDEIRLPRLAIAQGLSPQMQENSSQYIEGLRQNDLFNDITGEIYGRGPMLFVIVRRDVRRIEFIPRAEGGGIEDFDVPADDARNEWTKDADGTKIPPVATKFTEFISLLLRPGKEPEPIVISIKETNKFNRFSIQQLNLFVKARNAPIYSGLYSVVSKPESNSKGTFGIPVFKNAGFINTDTPAGAYLYKFAKEMAQGLAGKVIVVNRDEPNDTDFDPATLEGQPPSQPVDDPGM